MVRIRFPIVWKFLIPTVLAAVALMLACHNNNGGGETTPTGCPSGSVQAFPGSDTCVLDPASIPKFVIPLVIPPVMNDMVPEDPAQDTYEIAVRQFRQQILPGGIWNTINGRTDAFPATTVWSYGPAADPPPDSSGLGGGVGIAPATDSQFNYPAYTIETTSNTEVNVRWINDLRDPSTNACLPHLLPIDQTLHWANPPQDCRDGSTRTDCAGQNPAPYMGPVPIVTHLHGAHVDPHSDGYPEAWWLPACDMSPFPEYATMGRLFDDATGANPGNLGYADFSYRNDQPATTLWYHDHSLGMTRSNVYAGPAGFWLIRGDYTPPSGPVVPDTVDDVSTPTANDGVLPGPAPVAGQSVLELNDPTNPVRQGIREIPIVIQDRSFQPNGDLFYPDNRAYFEGLNPTGGTDPILDIPFVPDSDIAPIWNPEAFFHVMVVNGVSWPVLEVAPALYRIRFLNGSNSRFLWLKFADPDVAAHQIGAEQGFLAAPVNMNGLDLDGTGDNTAQILMGLAERADVIVDFRALADGAEVELLNIGPDDPFGGGVPCPAGQNPDDNPGCGDFAPADPGTTGKVMKFTVNSALLQPGDGNATDPAQLVLNREGSLGASVVTRQVSLNEGESEQLCVADDGAGNIAFTGNAPPCPPGEEAFAPKEALLGTVDLSGESPAGIPLKWTDNTGASTPVTVFKVDGTPISISVTENPTLGDTEEWEIYNFTEDAHPIHLHLVRFEVVGRAEIGETVAPGVGVEPWEKGYKDTVIAYPEEITQVKALFDIAGLYVWHCHIVEHEDNEMMRPYVVSP
jgi:spore coat protein A